MRAKNEYKFIAEAYDNKLLLERIVDGKLMCPEACCGAPVVECTCGEDCPHCNCFMIHKAMKSNGLTDKLLKEFYKMRDPDGDGSWPADDDDRDHPDYGEPEYDDRGTGEIGREDNEEKQKGVDGKACWKGYRREGTKKKGGKTVDNCVKVEDNEEIEYENPATRRKEAQRAANERAHKKWQDPEYWKKFGVKGLGLDTPKEDNEEPKRSITGMKHKLDALAAAQLAGSKHKPYVSSFVGSGGKKIFAILGSDGKIVHKTHNKREAHQWLKDNYENI